MVLSLILGWISGVPVCPVHRSCSVARIVDTLICIQVIVCRRCWPLLGFAAVPSNLLVQQVYKACSAGFVWTCEATAVACCFDFYLVFEQLQCTWHVQLATKARSYRGAAHVCCELLHCCTGCGLIANAIAIAPTCATLSCCRREGHC
jgi:hypothetical protein